MTSLRSHRRWFFALIALVAFGATPVWATEADMATLPVVEPFLCLLCHVSPDPQPTSFALNAFGDDFLLNARVWDTTLASLDSDGDNCVNGVELGDTDADGTADGNVTVLQSNPGDPTDCGVNTVGPTTWTEMKGLFNRN